MGYKAAGLRLYIAFLFSGLLLEEALALEKEIEPTIYTRGDFQRYAPSSAFDIVVRIPGFSIKTDDDGSRGFGQAIGNVLINGERVSGKSISAEDTLRRVSADRVDRVEVLDGTSFNIPGLTGQVANIVTSASSQISGSFRWRSRFEQNTSAYYNFGELALTGTKGNVSWIAALDSKPDRSLQRGPESVFDATGGLVETREEELRTTSEDYKLSAGINWKLDGVVTNLNVEYRQKRPLSKELSFRSSSLLEDVIQREFSSERDESSYEVSGDVEFDLGQGRLKIVGIDRDQRTNLNNRTTNSRLNQDSIISVASFDANTKLGERILRSEYEWQTSDVKDWEFSIEAATNSLRRQSFQIRDSSPLSQQGGIPTMVREKRFESYLTHVRQLRERLSLQVSVGTEYSEIDALSASAESRSNSFTRPKGQLALSWKANDRLTIKSSLERQVGQLDFLDFVATVNLDENNEDVGNINLVPQQAWIANLEFEASFGKNGAAVLTFFNEEISDVVEQIPFGLEREGPGNVDRARRYGVKANATLNLDAIGLPGAEFKFKGEWRNSKLDDPLTGESRPISGDREYFWEAELRHEIPKTSWYYGVGGLFYQNHPALRLDQISFQTHDKPFGYLYIGHKNFFGHNAAIIVQNAFSRTSQFERSVFRPRRVNGLSAMEVRERDTNPRLVFQLRGSF